MESKTGKCPATKNKCVTAWRLTCERKFVGQVFSLLSSGERFNNGHQRLMPGGPA
jgi:hypothetical protein